MGRIAAVILTVGFLLSSTSSANHIVVPTSAPTIQAGILASADGDTVYVMPGTYTENINFSGRSVLLKSTTGPGSTVIQPANADSSTIIARNGEDTPAGVVGFTIRNTNRSTTISIAANSFLVAGNTFRDNIPSVINPLTVIRAESPCEIAYNTFFDNQGINCIFASDSCLIVNNTLDHNARGVYSTDPGTILVNNILTDCAGYTVSGSFAVIDYNLVWPYGVPTTMGAHGYSEDPWYIDASDYDFRLDFASPCLGSGSPDPAFAPPGGGPTNVGAFGYGGNLALPLPVHLRSGGSDLMHLPDSMPTFTWHFFQPGETQFAYQIEFGTDSIWTTAELWTSGAVNSSDTSAAYGGPPLDYGLAYAMRMRVHDGAQWGAWVEYAIQVNGAPPVPAVLYPLDSAATNPLSTVMAVETVSDPDGDAVWYDFRIYADSNLTVPVFTAADVKGGQPYTKSPTCSMLVADNSYWWRCRVHDQSGAEAFTPLQMIQAHGTPTVLHVPSQFTNITGAVENCLPLDTIEVDPGTYVENISLRDRPIVLRSTGGPAATILEPYIAGNNVISAPTNTDLDSLPRIDGFTIRGTTSASGIHIEEGLVVNCDINTCRAPQGGGAYLRPHATLRDCLIHDNTGTSAGGGIYAVWGTIENCRIFDNTSNVGAGVFAKYDVNIIRNLIYNNTGTGDLAGAVCFSSWSARIYNNTIVGNTHGITMENTPTLQAYIYGNIVAFNREYGYKDIERPIIFAYNNIYGNGLGDDYRNWKGIKLDPIFTDTAAHDYSLKYYSPCIDAAGPDSLGPDPDGTPRDFGAIPFLYTQPAAVRTILAGENTWHVVDSLPTFYWSVLDSLERPQTRYELEVGPDPLSAPLGLWQSGVVNTSDTSIQYGSIGNAGALNDGDTNCFRIRVDVGDGFGDWHYGWFAMNVPPDVPIPLAPLDGDTVGVSGVSLVVDSVGNIDGDTVQYVFELYADTADTPLVVVDKPTTMTFTSPVTSLASGQTYYWRARGWDKHEYSDWCSWQGFYTRVGNVTLKVPESFATIQAALDAASPGDTIEVAAGTYTGDGNRDLDFGWKSNITMIAPAGAESTILDAAGSAADPHRVVNFTVRFEKNPVFIGFTFRNAYYDDYGGAVHGYQASDPMTFRYCVFQNNHARFGGAIWGWRADMHQCRFENNSAEYYGGAMQGLSGGTISECRFIGNSAQEGGVIDAGGSANDFIDCSFESNTAPVGSVVSGFNGSQTFHGCLFKGNGSGVFNVTATAINLYHCTLANNNGAVAVLWEANANFHDCIVANNAGAAAACPLPSPDYPYVGTASAEYSCIHGNGSNFTGCLADDADTNGNFSLNPQFCSAGDYRLQATSPCLNAASDGGYIGAFEMGCEPVDVPGDEPTVPYHYELAQNHPNPFNPSTTIEYSLEENSDVRLVVYNLLGQTVAELVNAKQTAGPHTFIWDGTNGAGRAVASGVYIYRIEAGDFAASRKMLLLK